MDITIGNFKSAMDAEDSFIIPPSLFDEKPFIVVDILFCEEKENKYKDFITKFNHSTNGKCCISVNWITKKVTQSARSIMGYALARRTILANQNVTW